MKQQVIGPYDCLIQSSADENSPRATIVLLHGYGANARDLAPLADFLDPQRDFCWIFPNAPLSLAFNPNFDSRAWFPIEMDLLQKALETGDVGFFADSLPRDFLAARDGIVAVLRAMDVKSPLVLGGFSQGSMLAADITFADEFAVDKLVLLSTTLVAKERWLDLLENSQKSYSVFQSHGRQDPVLPYQGACQVKAMLEHCGVKLSFVDFDDGHTVAPEALARLAQFLRS